MKKETQEKLEKKERYKIIALKELEELKEKSNGAAAAFREGNFTAKLTKGALRLWTMFQRLLKRIEVRWPLLKEFIVFWLLSNAVTFWMPLGQKFLPLAVYNILVTVIIGGVSMLIFFFIFKIIFPRAEEKEKT